MRTRQFFWLSFALFGLSLPVHSVDAATDIPATAFHVNFTLSRHVTIDTLSTYRDQLENYIEECLPVGGFVSDATPYHPEGPWGISIPEKTNHAPYTAAEAQQLLSACQTKPKLVTDIHIDPF